MGLNRVSSQHVFSEPICTANILVAVVKASTVPLGFQGCARIIYGKMAEGNCRTKG